MSARHRAKSPLAKVRRGLRSQRAASFRDLVAKAAVEFVKYMRSPIPRTPTELAAHHEARELARAVDALEKFERENPK